MLAATDRLALQRNVSDKDIEQQKVRDVAYQSATLRRFIDQYDAESATYQDAKSKRAANASTLGSALAAKRSRYVEAKKLKAAMDAAGTEFFLRVIADGNMNFAAHLLEDHGARYVATSPEAAA